MSPTPLVCNRGPSVRIQFVMDYSMAEWEKWKQVNDWPHDKKQDLN